MKKSLRNKKIDYIKQLDGLCLDGKYTSKLYQRLQCAKLKSIIGFNRKQRDRLSSELRQIIELGFQKFEMTVNPKCPVNFSIERNDNIKNYPYKKRELDLDLTDVNLTEPMVFPTFKEVTVSIIIPCYNNFDLTMKCLRSILRNTSGISYEIIIADDKSTDQTKNITDYVLNIKYVKNKQENGFVNNCNTGASVAEGKYFYFLNNDTQVQPGYLDSLVKTIESESDIGIVGSMLIFPDGKLQEAGAMVYEDANGANVGRNLDNYEDATVNYVRDTDYVSGASLLVKSDLFKELKGFDAVYSPAYFEDSDLCMRVWYKKKQRVVYQPKSRIVHFEGKSFPSEQKKALMNKNRKTFYNRFFNELSSHHFCANYSSFVFRDHSSHKKQMLVVDWKILSPSYDTGSRVTFQYMQLFKKMNMNVKFYPMDVYLEKHEFLDDIEQLGIEVILENLESYIARNGKYFDYVFINRPDITERYINVIRRYTRAQVIYQGHDLHYLRHYRENLLNKKANADELMQNERERELNIISCTDLPCFLSQSEVDIVNQFDPFSHCIKLPIFLYDVNKMTNVYKASERKDICFVAGFKHNPNIDGACWFVHKIYPMVKKKIPEMKIFIIGSNPTDEVKALASADVIVTGYVTDEQLSEYYSKVRIAVIPLNFGAGVKGKTVEAVYNKVPVVTTSVGAEGIDNSLGVLTVKDNADEFADKLIELYNDYEELQRISDLSYEFIKTQFTPEVALDLFDKLLIK